MRERTAELSDVNEALAVAKTKADEANLDKTRFLAAASHDILQPLNAASLYATSLTERHWPPSEAGLAKQCRRVTVGGGGDFWCSDRDLQDRFRPPRAGDHASLRSHDVFEQLKVEFEPLAASQGVGTAHRGNVRRGSARTGGCCDACCRTLSATRSNTRAWARCCSGRVVAVTSIVLQICDTGPGIPRDKQALIFKEFQRLEGPGSTVRGVGLGLSIVERIGKILEHPITIISDAGRGSIFSVTVPRTEPRLAAKVEGLPAASLGNLGGLRVLCVDNEPAVLAGMEALLLGWGCEVHKAPSTLKAVQAVAAMAGPPDVMLADYHLDTGTGVDAVLAVREATGREIPAVIITADHSPEVQRDVRSRGLSMLRKPLKAAALRAIMAQYVVQAIGRRRMIRRALSAMLASAQQTTRQSRSCLCFPTGGLHTWRTIQLSPNAQPS